MPDLSEKTAVVTGGAQGIGRGIATVLGDHGASVVLADIDEELAREAASELQADGTAASAVACDVTDPADAEAVVGAADDEYGGLDILVNNAGVAVGGRFEDLSLEDWRTVIDVNMTGMYNCSAAAVPVMQEAGDGRIVNIASIAGLNISLAGPASYTASKWGVIGLTKHMAYDLGPDIRVNAVCPGGTLTPLIYERTDETDRDAMRDRTPLQKWATPEDHGEAVAFLASDAANHITGTTLAVDGGQQLVGRGSD